MRVRIIKATKNFKIDDIVDVSPNVAFGLLDSGLGVISKDMTPDDYKQAGDKDGSTTILRTYNRSGR